MLAELSCPHLEGIRERVCHLVETLLPPFIARHTENSVSGLDGWRLWDTRIGNNLKTAAGCQFDEHAEVLGQHFGVEQARTPSVSG
jgi:hypothetical protein